MSAEEAVTSASSASRSMVDHFASVADRYEATESFLDWMTTEYGIRLDYDFCDKDKPAPLDVKKLLDEFFNIDRRQLEAERRQLLRGVNE